MDVLKEIILLRIRIVYNIKAISNEDQRKVRNIAYVFWLSMLFININLIAVLRDWNDFDDWLSIIYEELYFMLMVTK